MAVAVNPNSFKEWREQLAQWFIAGGLVALSQCTRFIPSILKQCIGNVMVPTNTLEENLIGIEQYMLLSTPCHTIDKIY